MYIDQYINEMLSCRFCFMCRHLSPTGIVSGRESDTTRGRTLIADTIRMRPESIGEADFADAVYRSDLSGASRCHCRFYHPENPYDEIGLQLALRRDIVESGNAPEAVKALKAELEAGSSWEISKKADVLFFTDPSAAARPAAVEAVKKVLSAAGIDFGMITGGCIGKALSVLGFIPEAEKVMKKFADFINASGCKLLVVDTPAAADALKNDFPKCGAAINCEVRFTAGYFAELAEAGKVKFNAIGKVQYIAGDYLKNYIGCACAEKLLKAVGAEVISFGTNVEESYNCGEGALVLDKLNPALVKLMAVYVKRMAAADVPVVVSSAYTANILAAEGLDVKTLSEAAGAALC